MNQFNKIAFAPINVHVIIDTEQPPNTDVIEEMPMDEFVSRVEYDERMKRIDDEDRRQNHRIDKLETITDQIADMAASIKAMVVTMQAMQKEQEEQGKRLSDIEKKPADNWNNLVYTLIAMVATAAVTYVLAKGGL